MRRRRKERKRGKRSFQSRQIEFRGSFRPSVRPTQPLTRSPMRWSVATRGRRPARWRKRGRRSGMAAMAFVLMALRVTGWTTAGGREGGKERERERGALTTLYAKSAASSSSASSIDGSGAGGPSSLGLRLLPSFLRRSACIRLERRVIRGIERFCEMDAVPMPRRSARRPTVFASFRLPSMTRPDFIQQ